jgi:septal ring factor EnvC (AmiA/AmiB activator)
MGPTPERPTFLVPSSSLGGAAPVNDPQDSESDSDHESLVQVRYRFYGPLSSLYIPSCIFVLYAYKPQVQLKAVMQNVRKLEASLRQMRKQKLQLQRELDDYEDVTPIMSRKRTSVNIETNIKIRNLEARVEELEKVESLCSLCLSPEISPTSLAEKLAVEQEGQAGMFHMHSKSAPSQSSVATGERTTG